MNVFGIGLPEMAIIFIVALLVFGPKKLPEIGRSFGKALKGFQDATKEFESEFKQEVDKIEKVVKEPMMATIEPPEPKALDSSDSNANVAESSSEQVGGEMPQASTPETPIS
ncbi:MAG: TatA/E family twin arginine-targeting protein translocase [Cyanobacteria bacterium P01_F01_bin.150]